jgi:hypothetical protein
LEEFTKNPNFVENEVMVKNALDQSYIRGFVVNKKEHRDDLLKQLLDKGIAFEDATGVAFIHVRGIQIKFDEFVHVQSIEEDFKQEWWQ